MNIIISLPTHNVMLCTVHYAQVVQQENEIMQHIQDIMQYGQGVVQCVHALDSLSKSSPSRVHIYASAFQGFAQAHTRFFEEATKVGIQ